MVARSPLNQQTDRPATRKKTTTTKKPPPSFGKKIYLPGGMAGRPHHIQIAGHCHCATCIPVSCKHLSVCGACVCVLDGRKECFNNCMPRVHDTHTHTHLLARPGNKGVG